MRNLLFLGLLLFNLSVFGGTERGNGGGGLQTNGVYRTFYSAGVYVNPMPETEIPGAYLFSQTIKSLSGENNGKSLLLMNALPFGDRKFYRIMENSVDDHLMARLIKIYSDLVNQPSNAITLFAITDTEKKATYLLPSYFQLKESEQAAILFHESLWILNPKLEYSTIISAEMAFQKFVEFQSIGKFDLALPVFLSQFFKDKSISLKSAFIADSQNPTNGIVNSDRTILVKNLIADMDNCEKDYAFSLLKVNPLIETVQLNDILKCEISYQNIDSLNSLLEKYPQSFFLKELTNVLSRNNDYFHLKIRLLSPKDTFKNFGGSTQRISKQHEMYEKTKDNNFNKIINLKINLNDFIFSNDNLFSIDIQMTAK